MKELVVDLIPAFADNYFFAVKKLSSNKVSIIDPGHAAPVISYLEHHQYQLQSIFITHHHSDHVGGANELKEKYGVKIYGPSSVAPDIVLSEGSFFAIEDFKFQVLHLPGHTLDHLAFYQGQEGILFCGDILFSLGCGRLFEGSYEQMYTSLQRLKALPDKTAIFCAHEYTLRNLEFSLNYLEKGDVSYYEPLKKEVQKMRNNNIPTIPTSIEFEKKYNLFLKAKDLKEFHPLRKARNNF